MRYGYDEVAGKIKAEIVASSVRTVYRDWILELGFL